MPSACLPMCAAASAFPESGGWALPSCSLEVGCAAGLPLTEGGSPDRKQPKKRKLATVIQSRGNDFLIKHLPPACGRGGVLGDLPTSSWAGAPWHGGADPTGAVLPPRPPRQQQALQTDATFLHTAESTRRADP